MRPTLLPATALPARTVTRCTRPAACALTLARIDRGLRATDRRPVSSDADGSASAWG